VKRKERLAAAIATVALLGTLPSVVSVLSLVSLGGCSSNGGVDDGGLHQLDDGHIASGCLLDSDCDTGQKCLVAKCDKLTNTCNNQPKSCPTPSACNDSVCDPTSGMCGEQPAHDHDSCATLLGAPGTCQSGTCLPVPSCFDSQNSFQFLACVRSSLGGADSFSNDPIWVGNGATNAVDHYGGCATNETAPEVAYQFTNTSAVDVDVTVQLTVAPVLSTDDGGVADQGVPPPSSGVDLDLIVLEGSACSSSAVCANPKLPQGGFAGITSGTGNERVTFRAIAQQHYFIVVDGRNGATADFHVEIESCGACSVQLSNSLHCNQTQPIPGNTASGKATLGPYTCANGTFTGTGNEQSFRFTSEAPLTQRIEATVSSASAPVTLAVLPESSTLACDATQCLGGATATGSAPNLSASVSFSAEPAGMGHDRYWIVVDAPATSDTTFGLQLDCLPYCTKTDTLDCTNRTRFGTMGSSTNSIVPAWGPVGAACGGLTHLTGSEYVYLFAKPPTTTLAQVRFTLAAASPGKHLGLLLLDAGMANPASCDPRLTCATSTPVAVAATPTTLASTGTTDAHYYWVVVDGVDGDQSNFALSIDSGCN